MAAIEIAIEIGTSNTSIFVSGNGIVLREPTVIAYTGDVKKKKVRAIGIEAHKMLGKAPENTTIVCPVVDGVISDAESCSILLNEFLKKIFPGHNSIFGYRLKVIMGIPTGLTVDERRTYEDVCYGVLVKKPFRVKEIILLENIILSAVGIDLPISTTYGGLIVNVGGGITEVAALSLSGVISGCGVNIGGNMVDRAITDSIAGKFNILAGHHTVRKLKESIGSLYENDISKTMISGIDIRTKSPDNCIVMSADLYDVIKPYYLRVADAVESIINMCPPEIAADIKRTGIYVVGGASKLTGLDSLLYDTLNISAYIPDDPEYAAILGAGKLLSNKTLLKDILSQK